MKDFNKDNFNDSIRSKFASAEVQPGNNVWEGIEAELLKQDNRSMHKKAAFYRNLAAAVIFIALISIYFNLQDFTFNKDQNSTLAPIEIEDQNDQTFLSDNDVIMAQPKAQGYNDNVDNFSGGTSENSTVAFVGNSDNEEYKVNEIPAIQDNQDLATVRIVANDNLASSLTKIDNITPDGIELPELNLEVKEVSYFAVSNLDKSKDKSGIAWNTNVNIGSGNFNPNSEITETPIFSTVSTLNNPGTAGRTTGEDASFNNNQEREAVEDLSSAPMQGNLSFTFGLNFGIILNEKWNIKSGIQYGAYRSSSLSSTVVRDRNSDRLYPYHGASSSTEISDGKVVNAISEYELYNDFQIVTIPLMTSYKVIDRKFDVSLVAGLSADFIIRNTLKGSSDQINELKFDQNDKQSYKNIFASSIAGIEVSYPFADKYAISVMPTYKRALSNVTTENATFNSMPAFVGLNMSLAYMF
ncbi:outer membrane beta-barrel protein [Marivirga sp.]|uniref:outer membrane beta-barrel protein n=1 Tax=Marivirga sp. TaxID=2018662 RepID=UPI0025EFEADE|nr:outer membrane beta-barrel protein [Marivirga sp.]